MRSRPRLPLGPGNVGDMTKQLMKFNNKNMQIHLHSCHYLLKQLVVYLIRPHNQRMTLLGNSPPSLGGTNRSSGCTFWEIILLREEAQLDVPLLSLKCHQGDYHYCSFLHVYISFEHMG